MFPVASYICAKKCLSLQTKPSDSQDPFDLPLSFIP